MKRIKTCVTLKNDRVEIFNDLQSVCVHFHRVSTDHSIEIERTKLHNFENFRPSKNVWNNKKHGTVKINSEQWKLNEDYAIIFLSLLKKENLKMYFYKKKFVTSFKK